MRPLVIGPEDKKRAEQLVEFASDPANYYVPGQTSFVPGDKPEYVLNLYKGFKVVFTHTKMQDGRLYRHLSVSVDKKNKLPHPAAVAEIAPLLGFVGEFDQWSKDHNRLESCIIVVQGIHH